MPLPTSSNTAARTNSKIHAGGDAAGMSQRRTGNRLVMSGRIHPEKLITHTFTGLESVEPALMLMKDKPRDLIKPLVIIE